MPGVTRRLCVAAAGRRDTPCSCGSGSGRDRDKGRGEALELSCHGEGGRAGSCRGSSGTAWAVRGVGSAVVAEGVCAGGGGEECVYVAGEGVFVR